MSSSYLDPAQNVSPPGSGGTITVPSGASSTSGVGNLSAYEGRWLWVKASSKTHLRTGASHAAATTGDIYLTADVDYQMRVPKDGTRSHWSAYGAAAGTIYYRVTSGPV